ncbi:ChaN family lipoprotein [Pontibacter sp. BT310]|uniref:ChaN family lipoprotein n=1 Tax=Pontibacter populi TaxID=890055 RepID=A0ABS6XDX2_9BACT|nr:MULTISPECIES: ChaN family lipoprotein [Pontibacter]MBJ6119324.1 ChaN family lipoprotein [Pontibacter sp. BT310]MBR0571752.1 ChaN family lipoprotein [Microvirga sp. STS03]MBW3366178.1 ChaN family lipoprotein [Pontibacter populi]
MKKTASLFCLCILLTITAMAQDKPAYKLFTKAGKDVKYSRMLDELQKADVVLFGEQHNDPIAHWLQLEIAKDLHKAHQQKFAIGAEMFETDVQLVLDEYLNGQIAENNFEQESRPWPNYKTDYKPVVRFAKDAGIPFVATNVPRRYAAIVASGGLTALDNLTPEAKTYIAPLPIVVEMDLPGYKNMLSMFGSNTHGNTKAQSIVQAQALKDATMAYVILNQVVKGNKVLHLNGSYHSDNYEGIGWYLKQKQPNLKVATITTVTQEDLEKLTDENKNKADFILVVPATMTKNY